MNADELKAHFSAMGVAKGRTVLVHSSFKSLGPVEGGPQGVLDALLALVGSDGTLVMPAYNFTSWTEGHYFDLAHTRSEMGVLTEVARRGPAFRRTGHPIYSFAAAGRLAAELADIESVASYGPGSVFDRLHRENSVIVSLGLGFNATFTMTHHVESISGACRYRYEKPFSGIYVGRDGKPSLKTYSMMVRDIAQGVQTDIIPAMTRLVEGGAIKEYSINGALCHFSYSRDFVDALLPIVRSSPEMLHKKGKPA